MAPPNNDAPDAGAAIEPPGPIQLRVDIKRMLITVFVAMVCIELLMLVFDCFFNYANYIESRELRRMFNMTREDGMGSWVAVTQTSFVAATLWLVFAVSRRVPGLVWWQVLGWFVLAAFFSYMALDDGSRLHERVGSTFSHSMRDAPVVVGEKGLLDKVFDIFPSYGWQFVFLPFFGAMGIFTVLFLWTQVQDGISRFMVVTAIGCFVLAVGMDFIEGLDDDHFLNIYYPLGQGASFDNFARATFGENGFDTIVHFSKAVEETIEMFGNTLLWVVFLRHLAHIAPTLSFRFEQAEASALAPTPEAGEEAGDES